MAKPFTRSAINHFLKCNLPEYVDADIMKVVEFWVDIKRLKKNTVPWISHKLANQFKHFIAIEWQGLKFYGTQILKENYSVIKGEIDAWVNGEGERCKCGSPMIKRRNSKDNSFFYGCASFPVCKQTKPFN